MRPTSFIGLMGLVIVGIIVADVLTHGPATVQAANGMTSVLDPTYNALLGKTS